MPGRRRRRRPGFTASPSGILLVFMGLVLIIFAASFYFGYWEPDSAELLPSEGTAEPSKESLERRSRPSESSSTPGSPSSASFTEGSPEPGTDQVFSGNSSEAESEERERVTTIDPERSPSPPPGRGARVALVIDDLGRSLQDLRTLGDLGIDLTYAVLPFESRTPEVVAELRRRQEEIICHLPMEPSNEANPGPGALRGAMSYEELVAGTHRALEAVPGLVGVNNHMGSGLTTDADRMAAILGVLKQQRLFFLDSRTSAKSVGYQVAVEEGIPAAERQVFLDGDRNPEVIRDQFRLTLDIARRRGAAVVIGHPYPETLSILGEEVPRARQQGYDFVPVSFLLDRSGGLQE